MRHKSLENYARTLTVGALIVAALWVRLYHFSNRITLSMEQGMTLATTASYVYDKFSLLGMANVQRVTHDGHMVLVNPLYNYLLIPPLLITHGDPIAMTYVALFTNIVTAAAIYWLSRKMKLSRRVSFFATAFFLFNTVMIEQSLTLWIHNAVPLLGLVTLYLLYKEGKQDKWWIPLALGILSGTGYAFEYLYLGTAIIVGLLTLIFTKKKWQALVLYGVGFLVPQLPIIAFDIRHDWYTLRTLWTYTLDTLHHPGQTRLNIYHFFQFIPALCIAGGMLVDWVCKRWRLLGYTIVALYIVANLGAKTVQWGTAQPKITAPDVLAMSAVVAAHVTGPYNIVYKPDSEYRAYVMRYILTYRLRKPPLGIEAYPSADTLFVVAVRGENLLINQPWEIAVLHAKKQTELSSVTGNEYALYELTK